jgi:hypothetical protein
LIDTGAACIAHLHSAEGGLDILCEPQGHFMRRGGDRAADEWARMVDEGMGVRRTAKSVVSRSDSQRLCIAYLRKLVGGER